MLARIVFGRAASKGILLFRFGQIPSWISGTPAAASDLGRPRVAYFTRTAGEHSGVDGFRAVIERPVLGRRIRRGCWLFR